MFFSNNLPNGKYSELKPELILSTLQKLERRIIDRFPGSGLSKVTAELREVANPMVKFVKKLPRPLWSIRVLTLIAIILLVGLAVWLASLIVRLVPAGESGLMEILQGAESAINEVIFLSLAILFLATMENRIKRRAALNSLHRLRSFAHVVDMHQLTKDPADLIDPSTRDASYEEKAMTAQQLTRYLDYCTELLAINSKLAALHVQYLKDSEVLNTVNEVEMLAHELSNKIWQKIMILDVMVAKEKEAAEEAARLAAVRHGEQKNH